MGSGVQVNGVTEAGQSATLPGINYDYINQINPNFSASPLFQQAQGQYNTGNTAQAGNIAGANDLQGQLNGQGGIQNQSSVLSGLMNNAQSYQNVANASAQGTQNQQNVFNQQQALADQFGQVAAGQGPNPAQAQLAQATGQNVQNQAALMAGQRGAGANAGLLARQIAQQGAATQQNAVGQAATLQAQQSLNAMGQQAAQQQALQNVAGQQVGQQYAGLSGAQGALNGAGNLSAQQIQQILANQGQILGAQQNQNTNALNQQGQIGSLIQNQNQGNIAIQSGSQNAQNINNNRSANVFGGLLNGAGGVAAAAAGKYKGGEIEKENPKLAQVPQKDRFPKALVPSHIQHVAKIYHGNSFSMGGNVGSKLKSGGQVPGKAPLKGDHEKNDTVAAKLSPGEVVIPKSVMESKDPVKASAQFVAQVLKKKNMSGGKEKEASEFKKALTQAISGRGKK